MPFPPCVAPSSSAWQGVVGEDCSSPMGRHVVCAFPGRVPQPPCQDRQRRVTSLKRGARHLPQTLSHSRPPEIRRTVLMAHSNDDYLVNSMLVDHAIRKAVQEAPPRARRQSLPRERELAYPAQRSFHLFLKPGTETWQLTLVELRGVKQISPCRSKDADSHFFLR